MQKLSKPSITTYRVVNRNLHKEGDSQRRNNPGEQSYREITYHLIHWN